MLPLSTSGATAAFPVHLGIPARSSMPVSEISALLWHYFSALAADLIILIFTMEAHTFFSAYCAPLLINPLT